MQIAAGICTYSSPHLLLRCLRSLEGLTDLNIVIHGRFRGFPEVLPHNDSYWMVAKIADEFNNVELVDIKAAGGNQLEPWDLRLRTQMYHRNQYLRIAKEKNIDWLLVTDDDDYLVSKRTNITQVRSHLENLRRQINSVRMEKRYFLYNVACIQTEDEELPTSYMWQRPRLLYEPGHFRYMDTAHYHLVDPIGRIYKGHPGHELIPGLFLRHDQEANDKERLPDYMKAKRKYEVWQSTNESD